MSSVGDGDPAYSARFIIDPKDKVAVASIEGAMLEAAKDKWKDKGATVLAQLIKDGRVCFGKDTYTNKDGEPYDGFDGMFHIGARNGGETPMKPSAWNNQNNPTTAEDGLIYGGAFVDGAVEIYAQDNKFGRRINCSVRGVRFVGHGDSFGGGTKASADEFGEPVEVEAEDFA
jgi:hypothetical protein